VITLSSVAGSKWGHALREASLGGASPQFIQTFKKCVFQQKFGPKYAKKCVFFFEKSCKITAESGYPPHKTPLDSSGWHFPTSSLRC